MVAPHESDEAKAEAFRGKAVVGAGTSAVR